MLPSENADTMNERLSTVNEGSKDPPTAKLPQAERTMAVHDVAAPSEAAPPTATAPPMSLAPQEGHERFDDEGELARGGMGSIRRVFDRRLQRREAMKVLDGTIERGSRLASRFVEEARIAGQLDHPNIVPIYDLGVTADGSPAFITMKMVMGDTFAAFLDGLGDAVVRSPHLERAVQILIKVCEAVSYAHSRGVIHCDIKPANLMIGSHGQVYVMDWGLAFVKDPPLDEIRGEGADSRRLWSRDRHEPGAVLGTPAYMAPEQARGRVDMLDERTDVFALGGTLYRLLTGRPPYQEMTPELTVRKARAGVVAQPGEVAAGRKLPPELGRIAMKALAASPVDRYQRVEDLAEDLAVFLRGGGWLPTKTFAEGEVIIREGEPADAAYIIVEGTCEAYKTVGDQVMSLRLMGAGDVFGEAAVLTAQPRTASVVARSAVTVKVATSESLELELSRNAWVAALVKALADRFRDLDAQLSQLRHGQRG